jgi:hypothetical protein
MVGMISFDEQAGQCLWLIGHYAIENCHSKPESQAPFGLGKFTITHTSASNSIIYEIHEAWKY